MPSLWQVASWASRKSPYVPWLKVWLRKSCTVLLTDLTIWNWLAQLGHCTPRRWCIFRLIMWCFKLCSKHYSCCWIGFCNKDWLFVWNFRIVCSWLWWVEWGLQWRLANISSSITIKLGCCACWRLPIHCRQIRIKLCSSWRANFPPCIPWLWISLTNSKSFQISFIEIAFARKFPSLSRSIFPIQPWSHSKSSMRRTRTKPFNASHWVRIGSSFGWVCTCAKSVGRGLGWTRLFQSCTYLGWRMWTFGSNL